jgi:hypothetical protein
VKRHLRDVSNQQPTDANSKGTQFEERPKKEKKEVENPCVGKSASCKMGFSAGTPWGRVVDFFDGTTRGVCGSACSQEFYLRRTKHWENRGTVEALEGAAD